MTVRFVEEAQREFIEAVTYYEDSQVGLGWRFKDELDRSVSRVSENPELLRLRPGSYRRINLRVFPYYLPYIVRGDTLWVLAVAHSSRKPLYWISRR